MVVSQYTSPTFRPWLFLVTTAVFRGGYAASSVDSAILRSAHSTTKPLRLDVRGSTGVVGTSPAIAYGTNNGLAWKAPVTIGGQVVELNMDTGSSYPWVFGSSLPKNETAGHSIYDPTKSETFINGSQPFSVAYVGDFGANGYLGYDTITLGNLTIENTTIGVATELTGDVVYTGSDGIIGLEPLGAASSPFVTAVFKEVEVEILTFDLRNDSTGTIDFGYVDPDLFAPDAELTTIPTSGFGWQLSQVSFVVNGEIVGDPASGVTLDTGGEVIAVSANTAKAYWAPLVADGSVITTIPGPYGEGTLYIIPCTTKLPDLTIIFGNPSDPDGNATITGDTLQRTGWPRGNGTCIGSVWAYPGGWIGAPLFYQYVVAMDYGSQQITFGPKASP
ncbi:MAG: hypothetical protein MMC23_007352 [Stictis urceolatum]|nr:hypothetical protein [Stictis urceolata]